MPKTHRPQQGRKPSKERENYRNVKTKTNNNKEFSSKERENYRNVKTKTNNNKEFSRAKTKIHFSILPLTIISALSGSWAAARRTSSKSLFLPSLFHSFIIISYQMKQKHFKCGVNFHNIKIISKNI